MHKRTKATSIPMRVKCEVWARDKQRCIICGTWNAEPNAHYIARSQGGLGINQNIIPLCLKCHKDFDGNKRNIYKPIIKAYLNKLYPNFSDDQRIYHKWGNDQC